jgi:methyl-accepting chemotaxis protein
MLVVVAVVGITGFTSIKSAYNADQIPGNQRDYVAGAYEGWQQADDQTNMYAALASLGGHQQSKLEQTTWQQVLQGRQEVRQNLALIEKHALPNAKATSIFKQLKGDLPVYNGWTDRMYKTLRSGGSVTTAIRDITVSNASVSNRVQADFDSLKNEMGSAEATIGARIPSSTNSGLTQMIVISIIALALAVVITLVIVRSITKPLDRVSKAADKVAAGNVDVEVDVRGRDEIAKVADSFRAVIAHLKSMSETAREFASGNLNVPIEPKSDGDVLGHALLELQEQMSGALGDRSTTSQLESGMTELLGTLQGLEQGLSAMADGDLTVAVDSKLEPITPELDGQSVGFVADRYNEMLSSGQASVDAYDAMREAMREKLGDQSSLDAIDESLTSLSANCLAELRKGLEAINDGDLTVGVEAVTSGVTAAHGQALGRMAEVFNDMLNNVRSSIAGYNAMREKVAAMIQEISQSSESLSAASTQMAASSDQTGRAIAEIAHAVGSVAQGAEQQVRSVDDAKRITDDLAEASRDSADTANQTAMAAEQARQLARDGVVVAENAAEAMRAVRDSSAQVSDTIRALGAKSDQIGGIVATITGIAAQTNLLALNAAIEAARAGEHGRGFAVVAEEVRHLAEESQQAAASISGLIEEIQQETANAVAVVEIGAEQTRGGVETVDQAREAFSQIEQAVEDMSGRVERIAVSVRQMAASGDDMRERMDAVAAVAEESSASTQEVSASTEQSSASTQQVAASAQQLAGTAEELEKLVGQFVLS